VLEQLAAAIASVEIGVDGDSIEEAIALRDRLDARIAQAVGEYEVTGLVGGGRVGVDGGLAARPRPDDPPVGPTAPHAGEPLARASRVRNGICRWHAFRRSDRGHFGAFGR
jgi:hypothetical protein